MNIVLVVLYYILWLYLLVLIGRLIIDMLQMYSRSWSPSGVLSMVAEILFTLTDPPLRLLRRYIPTLRLGTVALDLSFMVLFFVVIFAMQAVQLL